MWTQPHATICGWPEDSFLLELYRRAFTLSQMHLVPDTPSVVKKQLHKRAKQTARRPGDPLTSKPRRSFSFQKQKCVTFLSQNSSGFTTHTSDTSAGITFWETAATRRQNTGRGDNTQAHKLGGGAQRDAGTCNMSTTVFTVFHWDFRPSTMTVKPRALHFSLRGGSVGRRMGGGGGVLYRFDVVKPSRSQCASMA